MKLVTERPYLIFLCTPYVHLCVYPGLFFGHVFHACPCMYVFIELISHTKRHITVHPLCIVYIAYHCAYVFVNFVWPYNCLYVFHCLSQCICICTSCMILCVYISHTVYIFVYPVRPHVYRFIMFFVSLHVSIYITCLILCFDNIGYVPYMYTFIYFL